VKELTANGHSNVEVGGILGVDEKTVRNDRSESSEQIAKTYNENNGQKVVRSENSDSAADPIAEAQRERELQTIIRCESGLKTDAFG
jgi:hypothetical protein